MGEARNEVIHCDYLPFAIFAQFDSVDAHFIDVTGQEKPLNQGRSLRQDLQSRDKPVVAKDAWLDI